MAGEWGTTSRVSLRDVDGFHSASGLGLQI